MTQDLGGRAAPPNLPRQFYLMCIRCGIRSSKVSYSLRADGNICQPKCYPTN